MQQRLLLIQQQQQALTNRMQNRIYVGSLSYELTEEDVRQAFEPFGAIMSIDMPKVRVCVGVLWVGNDTSLHNELCYA